MLKIKILPITFEIVTDECAECNALFYILLSLIDFNMIGVFYMKMLIYVNIGALLFDIYLLYNYL